MKELLRRLWQDESGATMVEYGLMVALIAVVCIAVVQILGNNTAGTFNTAGAAMADSDQNSCEAAGGTYNPGDATASPPVPASCTF